MHVSPGIFNNYPCPRALPWSQVVIDHKSQANWSHAHPMLCSPKVIRANEIVRLVIIT